MQSTLSRRAFMTTAALGTAMVLVPRMTARAAERQGAGLGPPTAIGDRQGDRAADKAGRSGDEHRTVAGLEAVRLEGEDGDRQKVTELTEKEITNALQRIARQGERWIVFLEGHGELREQIPDPD